MTFVDDNNNVLEFNGDFAMTKQAVSFFNGQIKGDVSQTFQVDNNSINRDVLGYYGPQMTSQIAWTKQAFNRVRNGNIIDRGYIVIQSDNGDKLSCFYVSGNSNWVQLINGLITDLDYTKYRQQIIASNVSSLMSATSGIVFPLCDYSYNLKKRNTEYSISYIQGKNDNINDYFFDLYPCFFLQSLMTELLQKFGIKLAGSIINDALYKSIIIPPISGIMKRKVVNEIIASGTPFTQSTTYLKYNLFSDVKDNNNLFASSTYVSDKTEYTTIVLVCTTTSLGIDPDRGMDIAIYKNGALYSSKTLGDTFSASPGGVGGASNDLATKFLKYDVPVIIGDTLEVYVRNNANVTGTPTITIDLYINPERVGLEEYVTPDNFLPPILCIDIIKFVIQFFGCSVTYNEYSKTLTLNIINKIKLEDSQDWSAYYINQSSSYTLMAAKHNYIKIKDSNDKKIKNYNNNNLVNYGEGDILTSNTLKNDNVIFNSPFSATDFDLSPTNNTWLSDLPLINLIDDEAVIFTSIANSAGLARYTGTGYTFKVGEIVRITNSSRRNLGYTKITAATSIYITDGSAFAATDTGTIYRQRIEYLEQSPKIMINNYIASSNFLNASSYKLVDKAGTTITNSIAAISFFSKQNTGLGIDSIRDNLAFSNPIGIGNFTGITIIERYFNKISKFLQNPNIRATMLLPESVYQSFVFDQFIYLKTESLTGYFFVDSINNYVDSNTPVEVNLYML